MRLFSRLIQIRLPSLDESAVLPIAKRLVKDLGRQVLLGDFLLPDRRSQKPVLHRAASLLLDLRAPVVQELLDLVLALANSVEIVFGSRRHRLKLLNRRIKDTEKRVIVGRRDRIKLMVVTAAHN